MIDDEGKTGLANPVKRPIRTILAIILGLTLLCQNAAGQSEPDADLLDLASGAMILSYSSQYDQANWSALSLIDGTNATGWSSKKRARFPHSVVIELPMRHRLDSLTLDNRNAQEQEYPGISAREIALHVSETAPDAGFRRVYQGEAKQNALTRFDLPTGVQVQWLKLEILSNWGNRDFSEIMELAATGEPLEVLPTRAVTGVYSTNYRIMKLAQNGQQVTGCYDHDSGTLSGTSDGRVVRFQWRERDPEQVGSAIMVLSAAGTYLNGLWYESGKIGGTWRGPREPRVQPKCAVPGGSALRTDIQETGQSTVYGIHFDYDKAEIKPESRQTLEQVQQMMQSLSERSFLVIGHTDSTGEDDYNQALSLRRAQAVVAWLTAHGIAGARLRADGQGESEPAADNGTPQGRVLNRRVILQAD